MRTLVFVLGDQLDADSAAFDGFDPSQDVVLMAEVAAESEVGASSKARTAFFLSAMRHFRDALRAKAWPVSYRALDAQPSPDEPASLEAALLQAVDALAPERVVLVEPGEWRVRVALEAALQAAGVAFEVRPDRTYFASLEDARAHARGRKQLRQEYFYRELRQRFGVLLTPDGGPEGGQWNFDHDNRDAFGKAGPPPVPARRGFAPDATTREVLALMNTRFAALPGTCDAFDWPVTAAQALEALDDFIRHRLSDFGRWQDAIWLGEPHLWHATISAAMNVKLLSPRVVVRAAEDAYRQGAAPLASVEGFIRQVLGWREYVRAVYWLEMPSYLDRNALEAHAPLPEGYWTGDFEMRCLADAVGQTLRLGYAHHIQRLMVTGLYALLLGVEPRAVHAWYLAVYVDAVEWVELPNTLGMSQHADGGLMASKPYVATGKYIQRMSNACAGCRFDPALAVGPRACPFTTLYWDFLDRHEARFAPHPRMALQVKNLRRLSEADRAAISAQAEAIRANGGVPARAC